MDDLTRENKVFRSYSRTAGDSLTGCVKNAVLIHGSNSVRHEISKCLGAIMVSRYGDVKFDKNLVDKVKLMSEYIETLLFRNWEVSPTSFITEAWSGPKRRVDLVNLSTGDEIEFECNKKIEPKDGATTIFI